MVMIYLAGSDTLRDETELKKLYGSLKFRLLSYFYRKEWDTDFFWSQIAPTVPSLMVDSGAFSLFSMHGVSNHKRSAIKLEKESVTDYTHEYCKWLAQHRQDIDVYIELDVDKVVGWEKQLELRNIFEAYNLQPLYVHHPTNQMSFEEYCQRYDYVGIGSTFSTFKTAIPRLRIAEKHGTKCHIFGFTSPTDLRNLNSMKAFYSVDSSVWLSCIRYGAYYLFSNGKLISVKNGILQKRLNSMERPDKIRFSANQWTLFNDFLSAQATDPAGVTMCNKV